MLHFLSPLEDGEERADEPSASGHVVAEITENAMKSTHVKLRLIYKQQNLQSERAVSVRELV